jgi:hypothetical protein
MAIRALDFMAKVSSRFAHEILPVATASVIGAMLVNHYGRQPASPPIVVQAPPSASEAAMMQSLREERELIASFMKRREEFVRHRQEMDVEHPVIGATQAAWIAPALFPVVDPPLPEPRSTAAQKAVARLAPKAAAARKRSAPTEAPSFRSDPTAIALETPPLPDYLPPPAQTELVPRARPIVRAADAMGEWVADVAQASGRVAFLPRLPDWASLSPLIRPLSFFRQN